MRLKTGLVLVRQKPGSAKGVMFITLEDETGPANLVVWPTLGIATGYGQGTDLWRRGVLKPPPRRSPSLLLHLTDLP
ncbi:hypothetical protein EV131_13115 [Rhizobium laguerreae]|uniref:OB domain-containing protein n=1 Tax=Rhizobium laguerreae TaxID=1076926 RepID=A0AAX2QA04_9HYPH|nr:hypothetical protein [Rhizobium laguerreae]TCU12727.1 hypothetical protein EV131_13115 [Rhizobium laguerreae]